MVTVSPLWLGVRAGLGIACVIGLGGAAIVLPLLSGLLPARPLLAAWALAEAAFAAHYALRLAPALDRSVRHAEPPGHDPRATKAKLLAALARVESAQQLRGSLLPWFTNAAGWDDVRRDNLLELFSYAVWYRTLDQMAAAGLLPEAEDLLATIEARLGSSSSSSSDSSDSSSGSSSGGSGGGSSSSSDSSSGGGSSGSSSGGSGGLGVADGYNPQLRMMRHLWEPLKHFYRPLVFYAVMELLALLSHVAMTAAGFTCRSLKGVPYYTLGLPHDDDDNSAKAAAAALAPAAGSPPAAPGSRPDEALPLVFLHGVGAGLLPYLTIIFNLAGLGRPMVVPESKHVSMRLVSWLPTVDDMADATAGMLAAHGLEQAVVAAHSYGTMVASRLVLKHEAAVHTLLLLDPVCFAMFMPDLLRNFLYTRHASGFLLIDIIMALVSSEVHCAACFSRDFFWSNINLWEEHIPARTLVSLSGRDILAPTAQVYRWLREHTHAQVLIKPDMPHAGVLVNLRWQAVVKQHLQQLISQPASKAVAAADAANEAAEAAAEAADAAAGGGRGRCGGSASMAAAAAAGEAALAAAFDADKSTAGGAGADSAAAAPAAAPAGNVAAADAPAAVPAGDVAAAADAPAAAPAGDVAAVAEVYQSRNISCKGATAAAAVADADAAADVMLCSADQGKLARAFTPASSGLRVR